MRTQQHAVAAILPQLTKSAVAVVMAVSVVMAASVAVALVAQAVEAAATTTATKVSEAVVSVPWTLEN